MATTYEFLVTPTSSSGVEISALHDPSESRSSSPSSGDLSSNYSRGNDANTALKIIKPPSYMATHPPLEHKTSILGPTASSKQRAIFLAIISLMTFCGANNDFLGKLCYQSLPGEYSGYIGLQNRYWIAWLLTFSTFLVCSLALVVGWNGGREYKKMHSEFSVFMFNVSTPATCDVWVNLGRYVGLVFLPASVVTILKNGTQLLFSAVFRVIFERKTLSLSQWGGILLVVFGLTLVSLSSFLSEGSGSSASSLIIGIVILVSVGLFGSIRNHYEQILCRDLGYDANYVVGTRSIVSMLWTLIIAVVLLSVPMLYDDDTEGQNGNGNNYIASTITGWQRIGSGIDYICGFPVFMISLLLFCAAIYGKNVTQMKVIEMSSALTRNLTMQLMPIGTWILSLTFYYVDPRYGEQWNQYSMLRLIGFIIVLCGSYLYMKVPKIQNDPNLNTTMSLFSLNDCESACDSAFKPFLHF